MPETISGSPVPGQPARANPGRAHPMHEQLGFEGMPERLFMCTPSKLGAFADCPRRYRFSYVDRPAPPKGAPWAHNSLGASVHTATEELVLGGPPSDVRPEPAADPAKATWVGEGYRDDAQERRRSGERWVAGGLRRGLDPAGADRCRACRGRGSRPLALSGRVDRIDQRGDDLVIVDYKTGRAEPTGDDARGSERSALYAYAASGCSAAAAGGRAAPSADRHGRRTRAHRGVARAHLRGPRTTAADIVAAETADRRRRFARRRVPDDAGHLCSWCDFKKSCPAGSEALAREPWSAIEPPDATRPPR